MIRRLLDAILPSRRRRWREVDAEIEAHLHMRTRELEAGGMPSAPARREAERLFGELESARRRLYASAQIRDRRLGRLRRFESVIADLRAGVRRVRHAPTSSAITIATFAVGIGLTTATFSVVDHTLLRPLPFGEPERLVALRSVDIEGADFPYVSSDNWLDWRDLNRTLEATAIYSIFGSTTVVNDDDAFTVPAKNVSGGFFEVLRTPFLLGRPLTLEDVRDNQPVAVVSEGFWRRALGSPAELPVEMVMSGRTVQVVGVVRAGFEFPEGNQVWRPATFVRRGGAARNNINWYAIGRLADNTDIAAARADLSRVADGIRGSDPEGIYSFGVVVVSLKEEVVGGARTTLWLAMGAVLAVLLVVCANLAGLEFARRSARRQETAVRVALGAGRWRVAQQGVLEHVTLAAIGGVLGTALAWWGTRELLSRYDLPIPRTEGVSIDLRVLAFALALSLLAGVIASLVPSLTAARTAPSRAMAGARGSAPGGRNLPGSMLVAAEVALAVMLLIGGGVLVRNFAAIVGRELGFDPDGVVTASIALSAPRYGDGQEVRLEYWRSAMDTVVAIPGVADAAVANPAPTFSGGRGFVAIEDQPDVDAGAAYRVVSHDYFRTLDIRLLAGRLFDTGDNADSERVTIINRTMAETYWPGGDPLGKRIQATSQESRLERRSLLVIGVVEDIRQYGFTDDPYTAMYVLHEQVPTHTGGMTLIARTGGEADSIITVVRDRLRQLDRTLAVDVSTLDARLGGRVAGERLLAMTMSLFAGLGLALAAVGIYGLLSFAVSRRTREIAVRMAVGARGADVVAMVVRNALLVVGAGAVVGMWAVYALGHLVAALLAEIPASDPITALLVEIPARDPVTFAGVAATVFLTALGAALVPAVRAVRMSPVDALRRG